MYNATIRIATSLRLGAHLSASQLHSLGRRVDETRLHGLSCPRSAGRLPRHNQLTDIIKQSLTSANISSELEPQGRSCSDGKRPDRMNITPWAQGQLLIEDATCCMGLNGCFQHRTTITSSQLLWRPWDSLGYCQQKRYL